MVVYLHSFVMGCGQDLGIVVVESTANDSIVMILKSMKHLASHRFPDLCKDRKHYISRTGRVTSAGRVQERQRLLGVFSFNLSPISPPVASEKIASTMLQLQTRGLRNIGKEQESLSREDRSFL